MGSLIIFILILSVLVLIHEFGHFITAKRSGILVEEFGLGIPPKIYGKKIGETEYSLNLLPFGGFVRLRGEDAVEVTEEKLNDPRSFLSKTPGQRISILSAGVIMNMAFGVLLFYLFLVVTGFRSSHMPLIFDYEFRFGQTEEINTVIFGFSEESPLLDEDLTVRPGYAILEIDSTPVNSVEDVRSTVEDKEGVEVFVLVQDLQTRGAEPREVLVTPYVEEAGGAPVLGVFLGTSVQLNYESLGERATSGFLHTYNVLAYSINTLSRLIGFSVTEGSVEPLAETVAGPVGIYSIVDAVVVSPTMDTALSLIDLTALISISLAFLNILPLPALDGGRIVFVVIEAVRGKRINPRIETMVHKVGIMALLLLLVLVTIRDVTRIFHN